MQVVDTETFDRAVRALCAVIESDYEPRMMFEQVGNVSQFKPVDLSNRPSAEALTAAISAVSAVVQREVAMLHE